MQKVHSEAWFAKWEARLQEPIKNTKLYHYRDGLIKIAFLPTIVLPILGIIQIMRARDYLRRFIECRNEFMHKGRMITNDGPPGAGKTFSGGNMAYYLAIEQWEKLKSDYFTQRSMRDEWIKNGETDKLMALKALEESYEFYAAREAEHIPCLMSTVPLREYGRGRTSYKLQPEVFMQIQRVPEYTVFFNDESGQLFGADKSKTASADISDFWRLYRHFMDGMAVNTNQDGGQNMIQIRRSTDYVNHLYGQEWILPPVRLERKYARKERKYYKKLGKMDPAKEEYLGQELYYLKKYKATIGFRRVLHQLNTVQGEHITEKEYYIFPAIGGVEYDNRSYRNLYKCKDKEIELEGWESLVVDEYDRSEYDSLIKGDSQNGAA